MEASVLFGCIAGASAFLCGAALAAALSRRFRSRGPAARAVGAPGGGRAAWRLRHGVAAARPAARALLHSRRTAALVDEAVWALALRGVPTSSEAFLSTAVAATALVSAVAAAVTASVPCGLAVAGCLCAGGWAWAGTLCDRRREALREAVPDALRSMSVCFQAGLTLQQTLRQAGEEAKGPLAAIFGRACSRLEMGQGADEALGVLQSAATVPELAFVAVALDVQHQTGGSMKRVLDSARETVEGQIELRRSLRVQTAQARLSARVVSVMPFALIALFSLVSEGFLAPFFESFLGLAVLGTALGMQAAGIAAVRRMLKVEVA